ncbi:hypothetical protein B0E38_06032 [Streptomyces sp. 111WW2]|nr:hypothetical protein B0E38_06032 [Streptomyces sp. 111WW2]
MENSEPLNGYRATSSPPATIRMYPGPTCDICPAPSIVAVKESFWICCGILSRVTRKDSVSPACAPRSWMDSSGVFGWLKNTKYRSSDNRSSASRPKQLMSKFSPGPEICTPTYRSVPEVRSLILALWPR